VGARFSEYEHVSPVRAALFTPLNLAQIPSPREGDPALAAFIARSADRIQHIARNTGYDHVRNQAAVHPYPCTVMPVATTVRVMGCATTTHPDQGQLFTLVTLVMGGAGWTCQWGTCIWVFTKVNSLLSSSHTVLGHGPSRPDGVVWSGGGVGLSCQCQWVASGFKLGCVPSRVIGHYPSFYTVSTAAVQVHYIVYCCHFATS